MRRFDSCPGAKTQFVMNKNYTDDEMAWYLHRARERLNARQERRERIRAKREEAQRKLDAHYAELQEKREALKKQNQLSSFKPFNNKT